MRKFLMVVIALQLVKNYSNAQDISDIKLSKWYCCDLNEALSDISKQHNIKFLYDTARLRKIEYTVHPFNKPLETVLNQVCKENNLKYYTDQEGVVHVVDKWFEPEQKVMESKKTYTGSPTRNNFTLSGKVVDSENLESLPFVTIYVDGTGIGATSNVDGYFTLLNVPSDTVTVELRYIGYRNKKLYLSPTTELEKLTIKMEQETVNLQEVTVTADKQDVLQVSGTQAGMYKMSPIKLNALPNLGEKDILRSFQLMPGISAANENSSGLYVRGGTPDQSLVLYDGFTVYNVEHLFGFFSTFNSNAIKDVQLFKGGFESKYGGRLSSVVDITGKEGNKKGFNAVADISLMSVNGMVEFPIGNKITTILAVRRSWESPVYNKIFEQFTEDNEPGVMGGMGRFGGNSDQETKSYFYDINSKVTYRPNNKDIFSFSFYNGKDNLDNSLAPQFPSGFKGGRFDNFNMETIDLTNWGNTGMSAKWSRRFSDKLYINSLVSYSNYFSQRERSTSGGFTNNDGTTNTISRGVNESNDLKDYTTKVGIEYKLNSSNQLEFGLQTTFNEIDYSYMQDDTVSVIDRSTNGVVYAAYLQDKISLFNQKLTLTPGIRYNYFTSTAKSYFEPRFNAMYKLNRNWSIKGSYGDYYQFAKRVIREDITQGSRDFWVLSDNDKLPVSSAKQYVLGFSYETRNYIFDVEGYYKDLDNITEYSLRIEPGRGGIDYSENFFTGTGLSKGIDFLVQKKYGKLTGWVGYTLSQTTNNIPEFGDYDFYASNDVTNEFKVVGTYEWRKWVFGASWIYATGRPYTAPEGGYELELLDGTMQDYINVSVKNGNRLPNYHRLDLSATYNFMWGNQSKASLSFSLFNVYNRSNIWYKEYEIVDNEIIETPVYYLGLTPNVSFTIKFK